MKPYTLLIALAVTLGAHATNTQDTLVVNHPQKVVVIDQDSLLKVQIVGRDNDSTYRYESMLQAVDSNYVSTATIGNDWSFSIGGFGKKRHLNRGTQIISNLFVGFNAPSASAPLSFKPFESWELWWLIADFNHALWHKGHEVSVGIGVDWRNYRIGDRRQFVKADDGTVSVEPLPEGSDPQFSRVKVFSLTFPVRYHYYKKGWGFSVGPVFNLNTHATIKTRYKLNGEKQKATYKHIHQSPFTIDLMGTFVTPLMKFYAKYSPCNVLDTTYGPKIHSVSFGVFL
jgi:hypothetical protein